MNQGVFCFTKIWMRGFHRGNVLDQEAERNFTKSIVETTETASSVFSVFRKKLATIKDSSPKSIGS